MFLERHRVSARRRTWWLAWALAASATAAGAGSSARGSIAVAHRDAVREVVLHYEANGGRKRIAFVLLPASYARDRRPLPLVIAPHGRGAGPFLELARAWGPLPARGRFAVVIPEGQGRVLAHHSWGYPRQVDDLAGMPAVLRRELPAVRIDPHRIYAVGGSMGGQESLLLAARYPHLLAGVVAFDAPADLALRYEQFGELSNGDNLRTLMRLEIGGTPADGESAYAERSPLAFAPQLSRSGVRIQLWWSRRDKLVVDQQDDLGRLYADMRKLNPRAPVQQLVGTWEHTAELRWDRGLPRALRFLGLMP
jgi:poly(3-hydroxybutyrate) depolymerase